MSSLGYLTIDLRPALLVLGCAASCVVALQLVTAWSERRTRDRTHRIVAASRPKPHDAQ
jgi:hypothetical protein